MSVPDPIVLGRILRLQNVLAATPDSRTMAEQTCRALQGIPGLAASAVYLGGQVLAMDPVSGTALDVVKTWPEAEVAALATNRDPGAITAVPFRNTEGPFGFLILAVADSEAFNPYAPYVWNTATLMALSLETSRQRAELQRLNKQLAEQAQEAQEQRWKAEAALAVSQRMEEEIRHSEEQFRLIFDSLQAGILLIDTATRTIVDTNPVALRMFGGPRDAIVGQPCNHVVCPAEKDRCPVLDLGQIVDTSERILVRCDGTRLPILKTVTHLSLGNHDYLLESFVDLSERKAMEDALRQAKEIAEAANRAKSVFLASMSHEIRTPMNAILGFSQLMQRDPALAPAQREHLAIINRAGEHLLALINNILEMSKIEAGRIHLEMQPFDMHGMIEELLLLFRMRAEAKSLLLDLECAPDVPRWVVSDAGKLRQILINLLSNAVKFTAKGRVSLLVSMSTRKEPRTVRFAVRDTGMGIAPEDLPRLFRAFEQTASGRFTGTGTGLGLTISRYYARMLGGDIEVTSSPGQGACFSFEVTAGIAPSEAIAQMMAPPPVLRLRPGQPECRVLVVDDNQMNLDFVKALLLQVGFSVRTASDGHEAMAAFDAWHPHVVLMDMAMPGMDGFAATRTIKASARGAQTPVIGLTAIAFEEDRKTVLAAGADLFIRKPFKEAELLDAIRTSLGLEYEYGLPPAPPAAPLRTARLTAAELRSLPEPIRDGLRQAALSADLGRLRDLLASVARLNPDLAGRLLLLADHFQYETLAALLPPPESPTAT